MKKILSLLLLSTFALSASAGEYWSNTVKVAEVSIHYQSNYWRLHLKVDRDLTRENGVSYSACSVTDNSRIVGRPVSQVNGETTSMYATLLNAYNLNSDISLFINDGSCSSLSGHNLRGVKAVQ